MTLPERAEMALAVGNKCLGQTESLSIGGLGTQLAYLLLAILEDTHVDWSEWVDGTEGIRELFAREFPVDHAVWDFIIIEKEEA